MHPELEATEFLRATCLIETSVQHIAVFFTASQTADVGQSRRRTVPDWAELSAVAQTRCRKRVPPLTSNLGHESYHLDLFRSLVNLWSIMANFFDNKARAAAAAASSSANGESSSKAAASKETQNNQPWVEK